MPWRRNPYRYDPVADRNAHEHPQLFDTSCRYTRSPAAIDTVYVSCAPGDSMFPSPGEGFPSATVVPTASGNDCAAGTAASEKL